MTPPHRWPPSLPLLPALLLLACGGSAPGPTDPGAPRTVVSLSLTPRSLEMPAGNVEQVVAVARDAYNQTIPDRDIAWSVVDSRVATVSSAGVVTARQPGRTTVWATINEIRTGATIQVTTPLPLAIEAIPGHSSSAPVGSMLPLQPRVRVLHADRAPAVGIQVFFRVGAGGGSLQGATMVLTDASGVAAAPGWRLGVHPELNTLTASTSTLGPLTLGAYATVQRATADRADDRSGALVHPVYAVASDGADRGLDLDGRILASIEVFQTFARAKTGFQLRFDTYNGGTPDLTFVRLPITEAQIAAAAAPQQAIEQALRATGLLRGGRIYAVFYDGPTSVACGQAAPSLAAGQVASIFLRGSFRVNGAPYACPDLSLMATRRSDAPGYWDFVMLHEILHVMGMVSSGAPHHVASPAGHVSDPTDLMYTGAAPWTPSEFDLGKDDYAGPTLRSGLVNFLTSPFAERATGLPATLRTPVMPAGIRIDLMEGAPARP